MKKEYVLINGFKVLCNVPETAPREKKMCHKANTFSPFGQQEKKAMEEKK